MLNAEKLKKIQEFIELSKSSLTEAEFVEAFKKVVEYIKAMQAANKVEMESLNFKYTEIVNSIKENYGGDMAGMKQGAMDYCVKEIKGIMSKVDAKMAEVKNGVDGLDASVDEVALKASTMAQDALKPLLPTIEQIGESLPTQGDKMRDGLELLKGDDRLEISAIKNLEERLEEIKQLKGGRMFGGGGFSRTAMEQYFVDDNTPAEVPNGVITDFTPTYSFMASSLKVFNDGQRMKIGATNDYTIVSGKVVYNTAPLADVIITFDYRRA